MPCHPAPQRARCRPATQASCAAPPAGLEPPAFAAVTEGTLAKPLRRLVNDIVRAQRPPSGGAGAAAAALEQMGSGGAGGDALPEEAGEGTTGAEAEAEGEAGGSQGLLHSGTVLPCLACAHLPGCTPPPRRASRRERGPAARCAAGTGARACAPAALLHNLPHIPLFPLHRPALQAWAAG